MLYADVMLRRVRRTTGAMSRLATAAALVVLLIALGCDQEDDDVPVAGPDPVSEGAEALWGSTFKSRAITEDGGPRPLVAETRVVVTFEKSGDRQDIGWSAGCNGAGAGVRAEDNRLLIGQIASTLMGCEPDLARQDEWLSEFFGSDPDWTLTGNRLVLTSTATVIELEAAD